MAIQTTTFKKRLRQRSELSPQALLVALTIADLRYEARLKPNEPLPLTVQQLAEACHLQARSTTRRYLNECLESGWITGRKVYRDGRQKPNEYYLTDPTQAITETEGSVPVIGAGEQILRPNPRRNVATRPDPVLRSKYNGESDDAPRSGGGGITEQETPPARDQTPEPSPAAPVAPPPETSNEEVTDSNRADEWRPGPTAYPMNFDHPTPEPSARPRVMDGNTGHQLQCPTHGLEDSSTACLDCKRARIGRQNAAAAEQATRAQRDRQAQLARQAARRQDDPNALPPAACVPPEMADAPMIEKLAFMRANPDYRNPEWRRSG